LTKDVVAVSQKVHWDPVQDFCIAGSNSHHQYCFNIGAFHQCSGEKISFAMDEVKSHNSLGLGFVFFFNKN